jgi:glycosyltransferase involved in cell wall biosynthesis
MKGYPKISLVTPSFNQGKYLEQTIDSVLNQGYPALEYMVMDGGSTDDSVEIIKKHARHLKAWESAADGGQSRAINKGFLRSSGDLVGWLNSDDYLEPGALFAWAEAFRQEPRALAVCGKVNVWDEDRFSHLREPSYQGGTRVEALSKANINQEGTLFNGERVRSLGGVHPEFQYAMDLELWFSLLLAAPENPMVQIENTVSNFRRHPQAKSSIQAQQIPGKSQMFAEKLLLMQALSNLGFQESKPELFSAAGLKQPFKYTLRVPVSVSLAQENTSGFFFKHSLYLEDMGSSLDLLRWLFLSKRAWSPAQKSEYRYLLKKGLSSLVLGKSNLG